MKRCFSWLFVIVLMVVALFSLSPGNANAQTGPSLDAECVRHATLTWRNRAYIDGVFCGRKLTFFDKDVADGEFNGNSNNGKYNYKVQGYECPGEITFSTKNNRMQWDIAHVDLDIIPKNTSGVGCKNVGKTSESGKDGEKIDVFVGQTQNAEIVYSFTSDPQVIQRVDSHADFKFRRDGLTNLFLRLSEEGKACRDRIALSGTGSYRMFEITPSSKEGSKAVSPAERQASGLGPEQCFYAEKISTGVRSNTDLPLGTIANGTASPDTPIDGGGGSGITREPSCESKVGPFAFMFCPLINMLDGAINFLDTQVQGLLSVDENAYTNSGLRDTWARIRNIAYIILVPIMLVMVLGTALGSSLVDAYTVKKALPRMVAAVIFITLSWSIANFLIAFSNVVGSGILGLMTSSFSTFSDGGNITLSSLFDANMGQGIGTTVAAGAIFGKLVLAGFISSAILISYAIATVTAVAIAFFVLMIRQVLILTLVLVAPLAILAWIFPGNDKLWKLWWGTFSKLLLMFPLIMVLIGSGRVFAAVIHQTGGNNGIFEGTLRPLMIITAYVIPYFFIPATFKFAGGLLGNLAGMANDRSRGLFDKQRKKREEKSHHLKEKAGMGHRFNPNSSFGRSKWGKRTNNAAGWAADPYNNMRIKGIGVGKYRVGQTAGGAALAASLTQQSAVQSTELAKWMSQAGFNQEALTAIMQNAESNGGHINVKQLQDTAKTWRTNGNTQEVAASSQLENAASFFANITDDENYARANIGMAAGLSKAQQGFLNRSVKIGEDENGKAIYDTAELANYANFLNSDHVGLPGLGDAFKTQAGMLSSQSGAGKVGYSEQAVYDKKTGKIKYVAGPMEARAVQATRMSVQDIVGTKASQLETQFVDNGAFDLVLSADTNAPEAQRTFISGETGEKIVIDEHKQAAMIDNIVQAAHGYNTPAETAAVLRKALDDFKNKNPSLATKIKKAEDRIIRPDPSDPAYRARVQEGEVPPPRDDPFDRS